MRKNYRIDKEIVVKGKHECHAIRDDDVTNIVIIYDDDEGGWYIYSTFEELEIPCIVYCPFCGEKLPIFNPVTVTDKL